MEVDIPEGMTVEEALGGQGPLMKVLLETPFGKDIEVPRGMNIASMLEAGLIAPSDLETDTDGGEGLPFLPKTGAGAGKPAPGVFDPAAVKGAQERSTEVTELYAKIMANKANAKAKAAGSSAAAQNGYNGSDVKGEVNGSNAWLSGVLGKGQGSGSNEKPAVQKLTTAHHGHAGKSADSDSGEGEGKGNAEGGGGEEMVGYDFILTDRGDKEGKVAQNARASIRYVVLVY